MRSKTLIASGVAILALALTSCEPNEMYPAGGAIPLGSGNSGGYSAPAQQPLAPAMQDPEKEMERMNGNQQTESVVAGKYRDAEKKCQTLAKGRTLKEVKHFQGNNWDCIFY